LGSQELLDVGPKDTKLFNAKWGGRVGVGIVEIGNVIPYGAV
jgi:hypothetical protein